MSEHTGQQDASPHNAGEGVLNTTTPGGPGKQVHYTDYLKQLEDLSKQIEKADSAEAIAALSKKFDELQAGAAAAKAKDCLSEKVSEALKQSKGGDGEEEDGEKDGDDSESDDAEAKAKAAEAAKGAGQRGFGKGLVATEDQLESAVSGNGGDNAWFKDLLKAHKKLVGFQ